MSISKTAITEPQTIIDNSNAVGLSKLNKSVSEPQLDAKQQTIVTVNSGSVGDFEKIDPKDHKNGCVIM